MARTQGGLGLGLALVKAIVDKHGGTVSAASPGLGGGARFDLMLPLAAAGEALPRPAAPRAPLMDRGQRRILVIEDNRDAAETIQELLECEGHQVQLAFNGPDGIIAAREWRPELVLCDIGLPGMNGYQVASQLRADADTQLLLLVALSGYAQPEHVARGLLAGFDDHLAKPVDPDALLLLLRSV